MAVEFEHTYAQPGFISALQMLIFGSLLASGALGRSDWFRAFAEKVTSWVVTVGPMGLLIYVLYSVSHLV
jgi:hypothetical protein